MEVKPRVSFEPLNETHLEQVAAIELAQQSSPWSQQAFANELTNSVSRFLVMIQNHQVCGYAGYWSIVKEAHITTVMVIPELRGQGLGKKLVEVLLLQAQEEGNTCATLEVRASNEVAIKLYQSLGFEEVTLRKGYYPDNQEDAVIMWLFDLSSWRKD